MTTYIFVLLGIIIVLLVAVLMKRPTIDISALREDNARLRERLANANWKIWCATLCHQKHMRFNAYWKRVCDRTVLSDCHIRRGI